MAENFNSCFIAKLPKNTNLSDGKTNMPKNFDKYQLFYTIKINN